MPSKAGPPLKNPRHEAFAQALAAGETADAAYVTAGFKANRGNATRLKANESVKKRVEELQEAIAEEAIWDAADRLKMLKGIAYKAEKTEMRTAISAIAEANKMQGSHAPQKQEHDLTDRFQAAISEIMSGATTAPIATGDE